MNKKIISALLIIVTIVLLLPIGAFAHTQTEQRRTGLVAPSERARELFEEHATAIGKILPNSEGLARINQARAEKGFSPFSSAYAAADGDEFISADAAGKENNKYLTILDNYSEILGSLPAAVDLSQTNYFPAVGDQGYIGSCASFATTYYAATYQTARKRGINLRENPGSILSPKFSYNLNNNGEDMGSSIYDNLISLHCLGSPFVDETSMQSYQYNGYDFSSGTTVKPVQYREYPQTAAIYNDALKNLAYDVDYMEYEDTEEALELIRQAITNGTVLVFGTDYMYDWRTDDTIQDNPAASADDEYIGESACSRILISNPADYSRHAMTIVGYNDDIWVDINENGVVDSFETGALKIANSWGTGWGNDGYIWLCYSALENIGSEYINGYFNFDYNTLYFISAQNEYTPKATAEITINTVRRNQLWLFGGVNWNEAAEPLCYIPNFVFCGWGGPYSFAGTKVASTATVVIDLTDYIDYINDEIEDGFADAGGKMSLCAGVFDDVTGYPQRVDSVVFKSYENATALDAMPQTVDADFKWFCGKAKINNNNPPAYDSTIERLPIMPLDTNKSAYTSGSGNPAEWRFIPSVSGVYLFSNTISASNTLEIQNASRKPLYEDCDYMYAPLYAGKTYILRAWNDDEGHGVSFTAKISLWEQWPGSSYSSKLSGISLSTGESISPAFNSNVFGYSANINGTGTTLSVSPVHAQSYVLIGDRNVLSRAYTIDGGASKSIRIEVTSADWLSTQIYNVNISALPKSPNVSITSGYNNAKLSWNKVSGAVGYEIYRSNSGAGTYTRVANITKGSTTSWTNSSLLTGTTYYYKMRAVYSGGKYSAYSAVQSVKPMIANAAGLKASASNYNSVKLSWSGVSGASGYEVHRGTSPSGAYKLIKSTGSKSFTDTKLDTGTTYYYKIRAYRTVSGGKVYSGFSDVKSEKPVLAKTGSLKVKASGYNTAKLSWGSTKGATGYNVYRSTSEGGVYTKVGTTTKRSFNDNTLEPYTKYYYTVRAYRTVSGGQYEGPDSLVKTASTVLAKPGGVKSYTALPLGIRLTWKAVSGATSYEILRGTSKTGAYTPIGTTSGLTYTNEGLDAGKTYHYRIIACRTVGGNTVKGPYSYKSAKTSAAVPGSFKLSQAPPLGIKLSWKAVTGAEGYEIYRSASKAGAYTLVGATGDLSYTDEGLEAGKTYYYKVRMYTTHGGTKLYGNYTNVKYLKAPAAVPGGIKLSQAPPLGIKLSWKAVTGAEGYEICRSASKAGAYTLVGATGGLSYTDEGLEAGKTYYYKVRMYTTHGGTKLYGNYTGVKYLKAPAAVPGGFKLSQAPPLGIKLSWKAVTGAEGYEIYRSASKAGTYTLVGATGGLSYTDEGLEAGKTYYYKIRIVATCGARTVYGGYTAVKYAKVK
ncbi:MAG: C1 family peptidase [Christensenellales bacterium]